MPDAKFLEVVNGGAWSLRAGKLIDTLGIADPNSCKIVFAPLEELQNSSQCQQLLTRSFGFPSYLWTKMCFEINGFVGSREFKWSMATTVYNTWFRFLVKETVIVKGLDHHYTWHEMTFLVHRRADDAAVVFCFNTPAYFQNDALEELNNQLPDFRTHQIETILLHLVTQMYDRAINGISRTTRNVEKRRDGAKIHMDFPNMHNLLRHSIHITEVLTVGIDTINVLLNTWKDQKQHRPETQSLPLPPGATLQYDHASEMEFLVSVMKSLVHRSRSTESRMKNEVNLALNLAAQAANTFTARIAYNTAKDSAAMKTIAAITLIFLPATFVSTIFGMQFFNYTPATDSTPAVFEVSKRFWIYWLIAAPLTIATIAAWLFNSKKASESNRKMEAEDEGLRLEPLSHIKTMTDPLV